MGSYQSPLRKGIKWYRKVATELLFGTSVVNSWLLYNQFTDQRISILDFRDKPVKSLCSTLPARPRTPKHVHTLIKSGPGKKK